MNIKRLLLSLTLLTAGIAAQAQVTVRCVVANPEGEPLPFATVYCIEMQNGVSANFKGEASIICKTSSTLIFSAPGHQELKLTAEQAAARGTVMLARQVYVLPPVIIRDNNYRSLLAEYGIDVCFAPKVWRTVAVKIVGTRDAGMLVSKVHFRQDVQESRRRKYIPKVYVRIFSVGPDGLPGNDLLTERVEVPVRPDLWIVSVDVSRYSILLPREGIYAGLEWVPARDYDFSDPKQYRKVSENIWPIILMTDKVQEDITAYRLNPGGPWLLRDEYCRQVDLLTGGLKNYTQEVKEKYPNFNPKIGVKLEKAP